MARCLTHPIGFKWSANNNLCSQAIDSIANRNSFGLFHVTVETRTSDWHWCVDKRYKRTPRALENNTKQTQSVTSCDECETRASVQANLKQSNGNATELGARSTYSVKWSDWIGLMWTDPVWWSEFIKMLNDCERKEKADEESSFSSKDSIHFSVRRTASHTHGGKVRIEFGAKLERSCAIIAVARTFVWVPSYAHSSLVYCEQFFSNLKIDFLLHRAWSGDAWHWNREINWKQKRIKFRIKTNPPEAAKNK